MVSALPSKDRFLPTVHILRGQASKSEMYSTLEHVVLIIIELGCGSDMRFKSLGSAGIHCHTAQHWF